MPKKKLNLFASKCNYHRLMRTQYISFSVVLIIPDPDFPGFPLIKQWAANFLIRKVCTYQHLCMLICSRIGENSLIFRQKKFKFSIHEYWIFFS